MDHDQFDTICRGLYGWRYKRDIAEHLRVDRSTIRRWATGKSPIPEAAVVELAKLVEARSNMIDWALHGGAHPIDIREDASGRFAIVWKRDFNDFIVWKTKKRKRNSTKPL